MKAFLYITTLAAFCFLAMTILMAQQTDSKIEQPPQDFSRADSSLTDSSLTDSSLTDSSLIGATPTSSLPLSQKKEVADSLASTDKVSLLLTQQIAYRKFFENAEYDRAIQLLEEMILAHPQEKQLSRDLATALYASALESFDKKDFEKALERLRRSAGLGNKMARLALAKVLVVKGQTAEATSLLEEHYAATQDHSILESLVDIYVTLGNYADAEKQLNQYELILNANQKNTDETKDEEAHQKTKSFIATRKERLSARKILDSQKYTASRDDIQIVYFQREAEPLAESILDAVSLTIEKLKSKFGSITWGTGINIELVQEKGFSELTGAPPWAGAIFDGTVRIPYSSQGLSSRQSWLRIQRMAKHETTHAFLYALCGDRIPSWLGEGLSQLQEGSNPLSAQQSLQGMYPQTWQNLSEKEDLEQPFINVSDRNLVRSLYLRSLFLVGQIEKVHGSSVWRRFILQMCTNETPYGDALEAIFSERSASGLWARYSGI